MPTLGTLADVVSSLGTPGSVSLERTNSAGSSNDEGNYVPGSKSTRPLAPTVVHPISGSDRNILPEGVRMRESIVIYATEVLRTAVEFGEMADVLLHTPLGVLEPGRYIVQTSENWGYVSGHWRVFATREPRG
jgi:hypothetical protein